jgi:hypothetical protein
VVVEVLPMAGSNPKPETRKPKEARNPKSEIAAMQTWAADLIRSAW